MACPLFHFIIKWNLNGYFSHLEMLQVLIKKENPDIVGVQETHFKETKTHCPKNFNGFYKTDKTKISQI